MSVKVGVRVRPFNKREIELECKRCVDMEKETTRITDSQGNVKNFVYDYSFWSHDKFMVDPDGINIPVDERYADQQRVYQEIGSDILVNAWEGYNCCLFAYGQTGSGKSYSMIGYGANRGVIPIVCDQIFKKIGKNTDKTKSFEVMVSMMEIYNEAVRDLLQKNKKKEIKICESKKLGVYVEGLYKHPVNSYQQIAKKIQEGSNNRSIAATLMNESSSRSHTIVSINFVQKIQTSASNTSIKYSVIHLVDLAGSECVAKTGVNSKDRLRETAKINQSLSTLGRVIEILAENSGKTDKQFVPYRDSKLTFILRNALGGNSRTAMICAISPADDNYEETISTLRYASRAKKIQNSAIVNESDVDKLIRMLREENEMLKKMLQEAKFTKTIINQEIFSNYNRMNQNMVDFGLIDQDEEESLLGGFSAIEQGKENKSEWDDAETEISETNMLKDAENIKVPYITNISEDQLLSLRVKYSCSDLVIGNKGGSPKPDVVLAALGVHENHARLFTDGEQNGIKRVFLQILSEQAEDYTYVNGENVPWKTKKEIFDYDRLIFGTGCVFLAIIGGQGKKAKNLKIQDIDYQFALKQMQDINLDRSRILNGESQEELRKKIVNQVERQYEEVKKSNESKLNNEIAAQQRVYEERIREIERKQAEETEKLKQELEKKQSESLDLERERKRVNEEIGKYRLMQKEMEEKILEGEEGLGEGGQAESGQLEKGDESGKLERTNQMLREKQEEIERLEGRIQVIGEQQIEKELQIKEELDKHEREVQRELQIKTIMCENENIITEYRLEFAKRIRNAREVRDLLVKKEKAFLQKQLIELVPMVQKFNLMGREMDRRVQAGLSVEYKYISEAEAIEALKNNSYKSKLKILIHVINREELRGYYWSTEVFKNRFEHSIDTFQAFISSNHKGNFHLSRLKEDKLKDPYWEPESFEVLGHSYLSMECLLYQFEYVGSLSIVNQGKKVGELKVKVYPVQNDKISIVESLTDGIKLFNPRDLIDRNLSFNVEIQEISFSDLSQSIEKIRVDYELLESNYKLRKYQTDEVNFHELRKLRYSKSHAINQISENTILHYTDRPVPFTIQGKIRLEDQDELTNRRSFVSSGISSFLGKSFSKDKTEGEEEDGEEGEAVFKDLEQIIVSAFQEVEQSSRQQNSNYKKKPQTEEAVPKNASRKSGVIVDNVDIMSKIEDDYNRKRKEVEHQDKRRERERSQRERQRELLKAEEEKKKKKKKAKDQCFIY